VNVFINKINNELRENQVNMEKEYQRFKNFMEIFRRDDGEVTYQNLEFNRRYDFRLNRQNRRTPQTQRSISYRNNRNGGQNNNRNNANGQQI
jgi:hypothetical protein